MNIILPKIGTRLGVRVTNKWGYSTATEVILITSLGVRHDLAALGCVYYPIKFQMDEKSFYARLKLRIKMDPEESVGEFTLIGGGMKEVRVIEPQVFTAENDIAYSHDGDDDFIEINLPVESVHMENEGLY